MYHNPYEEEEEVPSEIDWRFIGLIVATLLWMASCAWLAVTVFNLAFGRAE